MLLAVLLAGAGLVAVPGVSWAATYTVSSPADAPDVDPGDGVCADVDRHCTLRAAIQEANTNPGSDEITFLPGQEQIVIDSSVLGPLPPISDPVNISGHRTDGVPDVEVTSGDTSTSDPVGLSITAGGSVVRGLSITGFGQDIALQGEGGSVIQGNYIGLGRDGQVVPAGGDGIFVADSTGNQIGGSTAGEGNVISTPGRAIYMRGYFSGADGTVVEGNRIASNATGTESRPGGGIVLEGGRGVRIGGQDAGPGGACSGSCNLLMGGGIEASSSFAGDISGLQVEGNFIGTDVTGTAIARDSTGVAVADSHGVAVRDPRGDPAAVRNISVQRNLIANSSIGVVAQGIPAPVVSGNLIGVDTTATEPLYEVGGAEIIGDNSTIADNVIVTDPSTGQTGLSVEGQDDRVVGNRIGTDKTGEKPLGTGGPGMWLRAGATGTTVGGEGGLSPSGCTGLCNVVAASRSSGLEIDAAAVTVEGNVIGTDATGSAEALGNQRAGVTIGGDGTPVANGVRLGASAPGAGNLIAGNASDQVAVGGGVTGTVIQGNKIGTNLAGTEALKLAEPNPQGGGPFYGIGASSPTIIGGAGAGEGNLIAVGADPNDQRQIGVLVGDGSCVEGNQIGTDAAGERALGDHQYDLEINGTGNYVGATDNTRGDACRGARNVLSGAREAQLLIDPVGTDNTVSANLIGTNAAGSDAISGAPAGSGVGICSKAVGICINGDRNTIGGPSPAERNVVSGNFGDGIVVGSNDNNLQANLIGTGADATQPVPNGGDGLLVVGADNTMGAAVGMGNTIANNAGNGVDVRGVRDAIRGNAIFDNGALGIDLGGDGPTSNDPPDALDSDTGANEAQNYPIIDTAQATVGGVHVTGSLDSARDGSYIVEIFGNPVSDPSSHPEGKNFLGDFSIHTDANGHANFDETLPSPSAPGSVTATATDASGNTSEFSGAVAVVPSEQSPAAAQAITVTDPDGHASGWVLTLNGPGMTQNGESRTTDAAGRVSFTTQLQEGTYTISETPQDGWAQTSASDCSFTVNYPADSGRVFTCTITNTYQPHITLTKAGSGLSKIGDPAQYTITLTNTSLASGAAGSPNLDCTVTDPEIGFSKTVAGLGAGMSDVSTPTFTIPAGASDPFPNTAHATCTAQRSNPAVTTSADSNTVNTNLFQPSVAITKTGPAHSQVGDTVTYMVTITNTSSSDSPSLLLNSFSDSLVTGVAPPDACKNLVPGGHCSFSYTYTVQSGDLEPLVNTAAVHYHPSGFPNDITNSAAWSTDLLHPAFTVTKTCSTEPVPQAGPAKFNVTVTNTGDADLVITADDGIGTFNLAAGASKTFPVTVNGPFAGQANVNNTVNATAALDPKYGLSDTIAPKTASVSCDVMGLAKVIKTVSGQPPSGPRSFTFTLRQGADVIDAGTILETEVANAGNGGVLKFTTNLVPGNHYQMCEDVMPGWNTSLGTNRFVPGSMTTSTLPNPNVNNMTVCTDFVAQAGQITTFTVDNTPPPGGRALTIGFWKNWASCTTSSTNKKPILDQTLASATATTTNPPGGLVVSAQNPGGGWPNFAATYYLVLKGSTITPNSAPDCGKAVNLLNKTTTDGKTKMASDPLFNMTAQLVGAQLNYFAGAGKNGPTTTNMMSAVLLDGKYSFNGLTYSPKLSATDTTKTNCLATQLDNYNNDRSPSTC